MTAPTPDQGSAVLLPCPFCGGTKIAPGSIRDGRALECAGCHASVHAFSPQADAACRVHWNTRAGRSAPPAPTTSEVVAAANRLVYKWDEQNYSAKGLDKEFGQLARALAALPPSPAVEVQPVTPVVHKLSQPEFDAVVRDAMSWRNREWLDAPPVMARGSLERQALRELVAVDDLYHMEQPNAEKAVWDAREAVAWANARAILAAPLSQPEVQPKPKSTSGDLADPPSEAADRDATPEKPR